MAGTSATVKPATQVISVRHNCFSAHQSVVVEWATDGNIAVQCRDTQQIALIQPKERKTYRQEQHTVDGMGEHPWNKVCSTVDTVVLAYQNSKKKKTLIKMYTGMESPESA